MTGTNYEYKNSYKLILVINHETYPLKDHWRVNVIITEK